MPRPFERLLVGHEAIHTSRLRWGHLSNGRLLSAAQEAGFDAIVTVDDNLRFQQNMKGRSICVLCLRSLKNDVPTLSPWLNWCYSNWRACHREALSLFDIRIFHSTDSQLLSDSPVYHGFRLLNLNWRGASLLIYSSYGPWHPCHRLDR